MLSSGKAQRPPQHLGVLGLKEGQRRWQEGLWSELKSPLRRGSAAMMLMEGFSSVEHSSQPSAVYKHSTRLVGKARTFVFL